MKDDGYALGSERGYEVIYVDDSAVVGGIGHVEGDDIDTVFHYIYVMIGRQI
jgi:hypothetical protein